MTDSSLITELTTVARGLGFEVICPGGALLGQNVGVQLHSNEVHFCGTPGECAAFLVGWRTLRLRLLGELRAVDVQGPPEMSGQPPTPEMSGQPQLPEMSGQPSLRGSSGKVLLQDPDVQKVSRGPMFEPPALQDPGAQEVSPADWCVPRGSVRGNSSPPSGRSAGSARGHLAAKLGKSDEGEPALERLLSRDRRQAMITAWAEMAFGREEATSLPHRGLRLLEEAIEAFQACGGGSEIAHELVTFVFKRSCGSIGQELGGVAVTLLALAAAVGLSADAEECREIHRVLSNPVEKFSRRNAAKNAAGFKIVTVTAAEVL